MKKRGQRLIASMTAAFISFSTLSGAINVSAETIEDDQKAVEYEIYPTPHEIDYLDQSFNVGTSVNVIYESGIDIYTKNRVEEILSNKEITITESEEVIEGKTNVLVGINDSNEIVDNYFTSNVEHEESFFENLDSHIVYVNDGVIGVLGKDADSAFYGVTSLKHVFNQLEDGSIREFRINDYADVKYRGFIEGYYGNPWSNEDRAELMIYGGDYKMNQYIFAPKDDPYHNSRWRDLYPEEKLKEIKELARIGNETKNRYVYALHPFMYNAISFNTEEDYKADLQIIENKFSQLLEVGVRQFAILADDAGVPSQGAGSYIKLLNDLTAWLEEQKETYTDLKTDLIFCPNDYMGDGSSSQLKEVNKAGENVSIVVTGGRIWGEVSESFTSNFTNNIASEGYTGRAPYMWINWPCSDNSKQHLIMGGNDTFLHPGVTPGAVEGIVLNPMQQAEANKSALFANADYAWNIWESEDEADKNWEASFKYMDHGTAEDTEASIALREISKHMINQNMDSRVTKLEESVELAPKLNAFKEKYASGERVKEEANELIAEFNKLRDAAILYKNEGHERVISQITYWLDCWEDTMDAAISYLEAIIAVEDGASNDIIWSKYSSGQTSFEKSKTYGFHYVDHTEYAEVGVQHIVPFIKNMAQSLSEIVSSIVDPSKIITTVITNRTDTPTGSLENLLDNNVSTEVVYKSPNTIVAGTYIGVKYNKKIKVKDIHIEMGAASNSKDTMQEAKLQYTEDGKTWIDLNGELYSMPNQITVESLDIYAMGIRVIATQDRTNTWLGIKDITINKNDIEGGNDFEINATLMKTEGWSVYSGSEANLTDGNDSTIVWYQTHTGDITKVGDYIGLDLGEVTSVGNVHVVVGAGDTDKWTDYKLEYSSDNENWTTFNTYSSTAGKDIIDEDFGGIEARYVRITNLKELNKWVKFSEFRVERSTTLPSTNNVYTNVDAGIRSMYINEALTKLVPQDNITLNNGEYIGIKLNRIKDLSNVDVETSTMEGLTLQTSMNGIEWGNVTDREILEDARYVRLIANKEANFNLNKFEVSSDEVYDPTLVSAYADYNADPAVAFDGNFNTSVKYTAAPQTGSTIVYDLGQTIDINNLKYVVLDTEKDHIRDGKIQVSLDGENWTDVINIENNIPNTSDDADSKATDNGYTHGSLSGGIIPISNAYMDSGEINVEARYLRVLFTAPYGYRWAVINEFLINNGEYIPTVNDPTFISNPIEIKGFAPSKAFDGNLTTAYKPNTNNGEITSGSLIYRLSENTDVKKINIVQSGSAISNAKVLVRTGYDEDGNDIWNEAGILNKSLTEILNLNYENIFEVKIQWEETAPVIYEIITINEYKMPNRDELKAKYDELIKLNEEDYTEESFKLLKDALDNAKSVLDNNNSVQKEIDNALSMLIEAEEGLTSIEVDAGQLQELVDSCDYAENKYTSSSWKIYNEALIAAKGLLASLENTNQDEINEAKSYLEEAIGGLVERAAYAVHLEIAIDEANQVTEEELNKVVQIVKEQFIERRAAAISVLEKYNKNDAAQEEVDGAFNDLKEIMDYVSFYKGDKSRLIELVNKINKLNSEEFIKDTWDSMVKELNKANGVIADGNALEDEVKAVYQDLIKAFLGLRLKPSKTKLEDLINKVEGLQEEKYTKDSWIILEESLKDAKVVLYDENASEEDITNSINILTDAIQALKECVDTASLSAAINRVSALTEDDYTPITWTKLQEALKNAIEVFENENASQDEIDKVLELLINAENGLEVKGDKSELNDLVNKANKIDLNKYTEASVDKFVSALGNAMDILNDENATEKIIEAAVSELKSSIECLELKADDNEEDNNSDNSNDNNHNNSGNNNNGNNNNNNNGNNANSGNNENNSSVGNSQTGTSSLPNTGNVVSPVIMIIAALSMLVLGSFAVKKTRKSAESNK